MDQFDAFKAMGEFWARAGAGILAPGASWPSFPQADLAGLAAAQSSLAQAWASATALSQTLTASLKSGAGAPDPTAGAVLARIFDPQAWLGGSAEFDAVLTRMAEGPQLADLWQTERRYGALLNAWATLRRAQSEHQTVMLDAWTRAAGTFAQEANTRAERGEGFASARAMMTHWIETANAVLLEVQRSDAFLASQRAVLKASTDLRLAQQDLSAFLADFYGQPTRAELDDVHKSLTELRREVRALRRERRAAARASMRHDAGARTAEEAHG
ncbi:poly(R)-hydroxyalkanoic acid synthase subunit PhaE [Methylobacterium sp. NEAU K]|uniref:poly(R)-hydroxyalkanoic acid synthase subunit PhaE n=1 Tax=Methylobacterium sp. NEAU K TaxID=3064946 RepID=UPI00273463DD|nr:poly(R)-hydroxyalkanoic acid synthase subunit PhaE [Methylobacterium sp. NEAU K]MDP4005149.1 poly(R)-hydroxyalkanoic acid synthase subunit PhaE [Methylobacterium sp. NEAU K]